MKKITLIAMLMVFSGVSHAGEWLSSKIDYIYPTADGGVIFTFIDNSPSCPREDNFHYLKVGKNGITAESQKNMLSLALVAASTGKRVTVFFDNDGESSAWCAINRLYVSFK